MNHELFNSGQSLTFDDILVVPGWSEMLPNQVEIETTLAQLNLKVPLMSAAMDTVTEAPLAISLAREGGVGVLHRNLSIETQADHVDRVKRAQSGMIDKPISLHPSATLADAEALMARNKISGVPICEEDGTLVGIMTNRDVRFCDESEYHRCVTEFMTSEPLVTAPVGTDLETAKETLHKHRIEKLPLVDDKGRLKGLITVKDIVKRVEKPHSTLDERGRLRVGAAVGVSDVAERAHALAEAGVDFLTIDTAHGHSKGVVEAIRLIRKNLPEMTIVGGNVVTAEGVKALVEAGSSVVKVGVGAGSICTTRIVAGTGMPQMSAIYECAQAAKDLKDHNGRSVTTIADGGIVTSGDIVKAFAAGANAVMVGNMLAGTDEAPGELELVDGAMWKTYRGMGSAGAMRGRAADRYGTAQKTKSEKHVPEGVEGRVRYAGSLAEMVGQLVGGLRSGMGYAGAKTLDELRTDTRLIQITGSGLRESHPHDIDVIRDANLNSN